MRKFRIFLASVLGPIIALLVYDISLYVLSFLVQLLAKIPFLHFIVDYNILVSGGLRLFLAFSSGTAAIAVTGTAIGAMGDDEPTPYIVGGVIIILIGAAVALYKVTQSQFHLSDLVFPCIGAFVISAKDG